MKHHRLPRFIRAPGGFVVEIKLTTLPGEWGNWSYDLEAACGVIRINKKADLARRWATLAHEVGHFAEDYEHWVREKIVRPLEIEMGQTAAELRDDE